MSASDAEPGSPLTTATSALPLFEAKENATERMVSDSVRETLRGALNTVFHLRVASIDLEAYVRTVVKGAPEWRLDTLEALASDRTRRTVRLVANAEEGCVLVVNSFASIAPLAPVYPACVPPAKLPAPWPALLRRAPAGLQSRLTEVARHLIILQGTATPTDLQPSLRTEGDRLCLRVVGYEFLTLEDLHALVRHQPVDLSVDRECALCLSFRYTPPEEPLVVHPAAAAEEA